MYDSLILLVLAAGLSLFASPIIAIAAHSRIGKVRGELAMMKRQIDILATRQSEAASAPASTAPREITPEAESKEKGVRSDQPEAAPLTTPDPSPPVAPKNETFPTDDTDDQTAEERQTVADKHAAADKVAKAAHAAAERADTLHYNRRETADENNAQQEHPKNEKDSERNFATKWLVWLGGLTIALGGVFLVKYSIDHGLLTPAMRIGAGLALSIALIIGGEWVRQRSAKHGTARDEATAARPDFVPPALTGAGIAIAFGSIYAGFALYGLLSPLFAFAALAGVCVLALGLSLMHGHFVAVLGVIGGLAVPALVPSESPSAWALFSYLTFIAGAAFAIFRFKEWWWLATVTLLGSAGWQLLWIVMDVAGQSMAPLYLHMIAVFALAVASRSAEAFGAPVQRPEISLLHPIQGLVLIAGTSLSTMTLFLLTQESHALEPVLFTGLVTALLGAVALRARALDLLLPMSAALALAGLFTWIVPNQAGFYGLSLFDNSNLAELAQVPFSPEFRFYGLAAAITAGWFALIGFVGVYGKPRKDLWAVVSGFAPLAAFFLAYAKLSALLPETLWAGTAMGLAAAFIGAISRFSGRRTEPLMESAVGLYALAALSGIALSLTILLDGSWLTIALSLMVLAAAWVNQRFRIAYLRPASTLVTAAILCRLAVLNNFPFPFAGLQIADIDAVWILYSYGLPAASLAIAARLFRKEQDDYLVGVLESAAIALASATVSLEIREWFGTVTTMPSSLSLTEVSLHSLNWLVSGTALYYRNAVRPRLIHRAASRILLGLGGLTVVGMQVLLLNPLTGEPVGNLPVFNTLLIAYLAPAAVIAVFCCVAHWSGERPLARINGFIAAGLAFLWINLEVRHGFHGTRLDLGPTTDAELYAYSIIWLLCAAPALIAGLMRDIRVLRRIGLGLVLLTVGKVFILDMGDLEGLYRVASFLGLGFSLVGIGYLYQRVFK